jgi:NADPH-dependent 2,4-dienoyl-CoA reductase/sulfur reductase-like enzyme
MSERLVVIGGGAAGMSAASAARRVDPGLEVVVLEATAHAAYGLCGLPYLVSGVIGSAEALLSYPPDFFRSRRGIDLRLGVVATGLDLRRGMVACVEDGRPGAIGFDRLVVTAGGAPLVPPLRGLEGERVFTVRTLEDAVRLRTLLESGAARRALVVGAGYIGLEMAEALRARGLEVVVAERLGQVMPNLDLEMADLVEAEVRAHGVDLRLETPLEELRVGGEALVGVLSGRACPVDVVVIAAGVRPNSVIAAGAGARTDGAGALLVDSRMRTSLPGVLAAGDCVAPHHRLLGGPAFVPLGPAANKTGRVAGTVAAGGDAEFHGILGTAVVKVFDLAVGRTGLTLGEARRGGLDALATDAVGRSRATYYPGAEAGFGVDDLAGLDLSYAPPYAPVYEPVLLAAQAAARSATAAVA